jgi:hypothetical protein
MTQVLKSVDLHAPTRADIDALQSAMREHEQVEPDTLHYFADGMYCRAMHLKAGWCFVGKIHKSEHFFMIVKGEAHIFGDGFARRCEAGFIAVSAPGAKRAGQAITDCVLVNVHNVEGLTDLDEIEDYLIEKEPGALFDARNRLVALEGGG